MFGRNRYTSLRHNGSPSLKLDTPTRTLRAALASTRLG